VTEAEHVTSPFKFSHLSPVIYLFVIVEDAHFKYGHAGIVTGIYY